MYILREYIAGIKCTYLKKENKRPGCINERKSSRRKIKRGVRPPTTFCVLLTAAQTLACGVAT